jgi:hypothetical protein
MDELDQCGGRNMGAALHAGGPGGQHDEEWPHPLAAAADDVLAHLADEQHVACELAADFGVDRGEVGSDEGAYVVELHGVPPSPLRERGILAAIGRPGNPGPFPV